MNTPILLLSFVLALCVCGAPSVRAQSAGDPPRRVVIENPIEMARGLMREGELERAESLLRLVRKAERGRGEIDYLEVDFLLARIAHLRGDFDTAIAGYQDILAENPNLLRVRLELADALYEAGEPDLAEYQLQLVLSAELPPIVRRNVETYLTQVERSQGLTTNLSFALVQDSNIASATSSETVELYGLPFQLSEEAQERSSLGLNTGIDVLYRMRASRSTDWVMQGVADYTQYERDGFNELNGLAKVGPVFRLGGARLGVLGTGLYRLVDSRTYEYGAGGEVYFETRMDERLLTRVTLRSRREFNALNPDRDGTRWEAQTLLRQGFGRGFADVTAAVWRDDKRIDAYSETGVRVSGTAVLNFADGMTWVPGILFLHRAFDEALAAFDRVRKEDFFALSLRVLKRDWRVWGFAPSIGFQYETNSSTVALYDFDRIKGQVMFTRQF